MGFGEWRGYDAWKLASPYDNEPQSSSESDSYKCKRCGFVNTIDFEAYFDDESEELECECDGCEQPFIAFVYSGTDYDGDGYYSYSGVDEEASDEANGWDAEDFVPYTERRHFTKYSRQLQADKFRADVYLERMYANLYEAHYDIEFGPFVYNSGRDYLPDNYAAVVEGNLNSYHRARDVGVVRCRARQEAKRAEREAKRQAEREAVAV